MVVSSGGSVIVTAGRRRSAVRPASGSQQREPDDQRRSDEPYPLSQHRKKLPWFPAALGHDDPMSKATFGLGFKVGHWTDPTSMTGCTVLLPPPGNVTSCDIRGSSPSSRELVLLDPDRRLTEVHGILLTGGSAFGLAAATGVVSWLEDHDIGYDTTITRVPIVPAAVIFDLGAGSKEVRPGPQQGYAACDVASDGAVDVGRVGAGTGATVGKWAGFEHRSPGGLGIASIERDGLTVSALAVVNSVGDVLARDGSVLAGTMSPEPRFQPRPRRGADVPMNTVLDVVAVEGSFEKREVKWLAGRGSDGITTAVRPAHTRYDGDVVIGVAVPPADEGPDRNLDLLGPMATEAMGEAVRNAVA